MSPRARLHPVALDAALALVVGAVELALLYDDGYAGAPATLLTVLGATALLARRRQPLLPLAVALVAAGLIVLLDEAPSGLTVLVALYGAAEYADRRVSLAALAVTAVPVTVLSVAISETQPSGVAIGGFVAAPLAAGVWGLGAYVQTRRRYLVELERRAAALERERGQRAEIATHQERAAIARELHDIVAHSVTLMLLGVRMARDMASADPRGADAALAQVEAGGEQSMGELRRILALLRRDERAEHHPQPSLADLSGLAQGYREAGLDVQLEVDEELSSLPDGLQLSLYRVIQEALTNSLRHGQARRVEVSLAIAGSCVELTAVDDGRTTSAGVETEGHGLAGMRERAALLGGTLDAGPRPDGGFRVRARVPMPSDGR